MILYLDSSPVLRVVLGQPNQLEDWGNWDAAVSSNLLQLEARRTLDRRPH